MNTSLVHIQEGDGGTVIMLQGASFDARQVSEITNRVNSLIERGKKNFIADLGSLKVMSSTVSSMLLLSMKKARAAGGDLILANVPAAIMRQLATAKLSSVFIITETVAQALAKFETHGQAF